MESDGDDDSEFKVDSESEAEDIMIDAAIRSSLQTASEGTTGPSSRKAAVPSTASVLRAAAAERRLAHMNAEIEFEFEAPWDSISNQFSSEEEPLVASSSKGKGKAASRPTKKIAPLSDASKKFMTMTELHAAQKEVRTAALLARRANKKAERALILKLGRRLTHASSLLRLIFNSNLTAFCPG